MQVRINLPPIRSRLSHKPNIPQKGEFKTFCLLFASPYVNIRILYGASYGASSRTCLLGLACVQWGSLQRKAERRPEGSAKCLDRLTTQSAPLRTLDPVHHFKRVGLIKHKIRHSIHNTNVRFLDTERATSNGQNFAFLTELAGGPR
ncbi:hypothetical protein RRG08_001380 [Elysia crispata]|uniref:Uncharacterized protein n=1 Tax=Elysia crispata TaxID=231223 RepID=A0AAE0ZQN2_9GAST|nr:hypothetical protein RRG08_001380 [Elysia crispata]